MSANLWTEHIDHLHDLLGSISFRNRQGHDIGSAAGFARWRSATLALCRRRGTIFLIGNGASASMASHMAADLAKNAGLHTEVFSDLSLITAISNDLGYEHVFSEPLSRRVCRQDMVVAISSSGHSANILRAVQVATKAKATVITLSAMKPANPLRVSGDLNIYVAARTYGCAESCHAAILHYWMDQVEGSR